MLIVGLGNPGREYDNTNHNIGFAVVDGVVKSLNEKFKHKECDSVVCKYHNMYGETIIAKPQTYMNNSGLAVKELVKKHNKNPETELIVIVDDMDTAEGTIRIRRETNYTTHNGIKSIIDSLSTRNFSKIKVSIGKKPFAEMDTADFVLSKIRNSKTIEAKDIAVEALLDLINNNLSIDELMQKYSK